MPTISAEKQPELLDESVLSDLRADLLRFAFLQLRNRDTAEDVVQDTFAAAFAAQERFEQRATLKTWVFSILKNKIIDVMRDNWNKRRIDIAEAVGEEGEFDGLFQSNERWQPSEMPSDWGNPEQSLESQQFWAVFEICMTKMPEATARIFAMRELLGLEVEEICKEIGISSSNCWVIMHRARMILRLCLQQRWFGGKIS